MHFICTNFTDKLQSNQPDSWTSYLLFDFEYDVRVFLVEANNISVKMVGLICVCVWVEPVCVCMTLYVFGLNLCMCLYGLG